MVGNLVEKTSVAADEQPEVRRGTGDESLPIITLTVTPEQLRTILDQWSPADRHKPTRFIFCVDSETRGVLQVVASLFHEEST